MKISLIIVSILFSFSAFAGGGGGGPICDTTAAVRCNSQTDGSWIALMYHDCDDLDYGPSAYYSLEGGNGTIEFYISDVGLINDSYWISSKETGTSYTMTTQDKKTKAVHVEFVVPKSYMASVDISTKVGDVEILKGTMLCR